MFLNCGLEWGQMNLFGKGGARCSELICGYGHIKIFPQVLILKMEICSDTIS